MPVLVKKRGGEMPVNTLHASFFQRFNQLLLIQPTTRNVFKSNYYLYHRICLSINKIVYYQHLQVSFEELLSLRLSDHFALVVGCINNN